MRKSDFIPTLIHVVTQFKKYFFPAVITRIKKYILSLLLLPLVSLACLSSLPVEPAPASLVVKGVNTPAVIPTQAELIRVVCLTADTVYMRTGAGTGYEVVTVLSAGDLVTVTGGFVQSPDGGVWYPVTHGGVSGFMNARYLCER